MTSFSHALRLDSFKTVFNHETWVFHIIFVVLPGIVVVFVGVLLSYTFNAIIDVVVFVVVVVIVVIVISFIVPHCCNDCGAFKYNLCSLLMIIVVLHEN